MKPLKIAFLPLIRNTFDIPFAEQMINAARDALITAGFQLEEPDKPISDLSIAQQTAREFADTPLDLLLIFQATFADSTMVVELTQSIDAPIFLWAVPEDWTGERLRLNSLCGINLGGHALKLRDRQYDYAYAMPNDAEVLEKIRNLAMVGSLRRRLKASRLGVVGSSVNPSPCFPVNGCAIPRVAPDTAPPITLFATSPILGPLFSQATGSWNTPGPPLGPENMSPAISPGLGPWNPASS